jgi:sulfate adenylyltransferase subunit 1 (EFTu-like GTPase family)
VESLKNMITGATQAESAILLIDVEEGVMEQTKRHMYVLDMIGIDKIIVLINKMDLVNYRKERFDNVKAELLNFLKNLNIKPVFILPVSAKEGANISKICPAMKWHKGPALLKVLDSLKLETGYKDKPLRFPIQDVYEIDGSNIAVGRLESGTINKSKPLWLLPSNKEVRIKTIKIFGRNNPAGSKAGENIGVILDKKLYIKRGDMLVDKKYPPSPINRFDANILWFSHAPLKINKPVCLRCSTQETACVVDRIQKRIDSATLDIIEENAEELKHNEAGLVTLITKTPVITEKFSYIQGLGRFTIECNHEPSGIGIRI